MWKFIFIAIFEFQFLFGNIFLKNNMDLLVNCGGMIEKAITRGFF
jgi:hypothetical protein